MAICVEPRQPFRIYRRSGRNESADWTRKSFRQLNLQCCDRCFPPFPAWDAEKSAFGKRSIYELSYPRSFALRLSRCSVLPAWASPSANPPPANRGHHQVPAAAQPSAHFNADAATEAYMAMIPPAATARSDAYFEGGYWLILWDFLYASAICLLLLNCAGRRACAIWPNASRASSGCKPSSTGLQYVLAHLCARLSARVLREFRPRAQVRPGHAELWAVDGR